MCACRKAVAFYFTCTQTHSHTLSVVNGIKHLGDNSPDGQTRNQASISTPASSSSYPFNHSIPLAHTHTHLPHTWTFNYIFHFPTAARQLWRWQFAQLINQTHKSPLIVKYGKKNLKVCLLKPGITTRLEPSSLRRRPWPHPMLLSSSGPPAT